MSEGVVGNWWAAWFSLLLTLLLVTAATACGDTEPIVPTPTAPAMMAKDATAVPTATAPAQTPQGVTETPVAAAPPSTPTTSATGVPTSAPTATPLTAPEPTPTTEPATPVPTKTPAQGGNGDQDKSGTEARQSEQVPVVPPAGSDPAEFRRVIQDLDRAIELDPDNALAYNRRGLAYSRLGEHERATKDFDRAVKLDPTDALAHYNMGNAHAALGWFNAAIKNLDMAFELDPGLEGTMGPDADIARAYMIRVHDHIDLMGEYDRAVEDYERAVQFAPDDPSALNGLCWFMGLAGRAAEALPHCNRALSIDPDYFPAYDSRALALALLGDYEKAVEDFTRFLDWLNDQSRSDYEKYGPARERWIASLRKGENPFTEAELQALRKE